MRERTLDILEAGIRQYIETGEPITSDRIYQEYDFGIKPAMIRCELSELDEAGFLEQNHPSGGRQPTSEAYRFFVDRLLEQEAKVRRMAAVQSLARELRVGRRERMVRDLAHVLDVLGVGYTPRGRELYQSEISNFLSRLDVGVKDDIIRVIEDIESFPSRLGKMRSWNQESSWPKVFVGESPITRSEHLSVVAGKYTSAGETFYLFAIGPIRMDYTKSIDMFRSLSEFS